MLFRRHILALEQVYYAEKDKALPFRSNGKTFHELLKSGHVTVGPILKGYYLTAKGRKAFRDWSSKHLTDA